MRLPVFRAAALGVVIASVLFAGACALALGSEEADEPAATVPTPLHHDPSVAYVGRDACRDCHVGNYANFMQTGMGRSLYRMDPEEVVEDWTDDNLFVDPKTGLHYRMFERDGTFYQRQYLLDAGGNEIAVEEHALTYAVGSNNHSRGYIVVRDGKLFQAPVCWDPTKKFWMFCPGYEYQNDHFARETSESCLFCHNGRVELVEGERNLYHEPFTLGIGCERCHGPGETHVDVRTAERETNPWGTAGGPDPTIVNPRRLPAEERLQVCFQCHLGDTSATVRVVRHGRSPQDFRPGMPITEIFVPFRYEQQTKSSYSLVSQADRMILSRCYLESGGELECLTCHNPHITVYSKPPGGFRDNCLICHDASSCPEDADARAAVEPADDCVQCHMRKAEANDRRYALFTDHWIRRDAKDTKPDHRTRFDLEPIFPDAFATLPAGERAYYEARAHYLRALSSAAAVSRWHRAQAEKAFLSALDQGFDEADAHFFLGKLRVFSGRHEEGVADFRRALERDAAHHDAAFAAAQSLVQLKRFPEAAALLNALLARDPGDALTLAETGRLYFSVGRYERALESYRRAAAEEPWNASYRLNVGMSLAALGRMEEAADAGIEAARLDPDARNVWEFLRNAGREAGRPAIEREATRQLARLERPPGS